MAIFNSKLLNYWRVAACGRWARLRLPAWMTSRPQDTVQVIWELKHMCIYIYCIVLYYTMLYYIILYYIIYFDIYIYVHIMSYKDTSTVYLKLKYTVYIYIVAIHLVYIYIPRHWVQCLFPCLFWRISWPLPWGSCRRPVGAGKPGCRGYPQMKLLQSLVSDWAIFLHTLYGGFLK